MALYFFHLRDGIDVLLDPDGRRMAFTAVAGAAINEALAIISADARTGRIDLNQSIEVEDSDGTIVHHLDFQDAVEIAGKARRKA
jgi:hypothetical protein